MKDKELVKLERKIVIGMIIDTPFLYYMDQILNTKWVQSKEARTIMNWTLEYHTKFKKAPGLKMEDIYYEKLRLKKVRGAQAEVIEMILTNLSDEVEDWDTDDTDLLKEQAETYCKACQLKGYAEQVSELVDNGEVLEAENLLHEFNPIQILESTGVEPLATNDQRLALFEGQQAPLIKYPGNAGQMLNSHMLPESFVVFLAQNKGGKSFYLQDAAMRSASQGKKTLLIQAGDMTQIQMERRMAIYLTQTSNLERYCGALSIPILDCAHNQLGSCEMHIRESDDEGPFEDGEFNLKKLRDDMTFNVLKEAFEDNPEYTTCYNCLRYDKHAHNFVGALWYKKRPAVDPLTFAQLEKALTSGRKQFRSSWFAALKNIKLITYASEALSMSRLRSELDLSIKEGFEPEVAIADYLDLFAPDRDTMHMQPRDHENKKWQRGRRISQEYNLLFVSASQCDADGFNKKLLDKSNFSEDRRKLDHVTAMIGLNMSKMGIMRMNEVVTRDTEGTSVITIMHRLQLGRPMLGSFF
jgi:hypothetical protein